MKRVGVYIYQDMTMLDVLAPHQIIGLLPDFELVTIGPDLEVVVADTGVRIIPDFEIAAAPPLDAVLVGGAADPSGQMADDRVIAWFRAVGAEVEWVTSVCSGALILAEAGLLDGYRAATHWGYFGDLARYPQIVTADERVVVDRNRMTSRGITAGQDLAFRFIEETSGPEALALIRLLVECEHPAGPHGFPGDAPPELVARAAAMMAPLRGGLDAFLAAKKSPVG